jgi:gliding motility-associated transport system ATP-binding protein
MIKVQSLSKYYGGKRALGPVSFEIGDGECVGFLGLNGAGKTTALRILACDLRPSSGTVSVDGVDAVANPHEVKKRIGFLPENPPLYTDMPVIDYLRFAAQLRRMSNAEFEKRVPTVLDLTHLTDVSSDPIGTLSHGYRQRVGVAQAIVHNPKLLVLDEPTRGLDPVQIVEMRNMIHDLKQAHTVLISSHILTEISQTCDRLLVLGRGALLGSGSEGDLASVKAEVRRIMVIVRAGEAASKATSVAQLLKAVDGVTSVAEPFDSGGGQLFTIDCGKDVRADVSRALIGGGYDLLKLDYATSELESTFIRLVQGGNNGSN